MASGLTTGPLPHARRLAKRLRGLGVAGDGAAIVDHGDELWEAMIRLGL